VCAHTFPLPFELWAEKLEQGQHLVVPSTRHVPADSLDPRIKSRSRMHWYVADRQARRVDSGAGAILVDHDGFLTETSTGNFCIVTGNAIRTPSERTTLGGISRQVVGELAESLGIAFEFADLRPEDVSTADEAFTSSTPYCLLPVTRFQGEPVGSGRLGPVFGRLLAAWGELVGFDIAAQLRDGAEERLRNLRADG
jgi:branched-subunit amino acid aminotransferase/4-amino-4-deoxychorismate lyase